MQICNKNKIKNKKKWNLKVSNKLLGKAKNRDSKYFVYMYTILPYTHARRSTKINTQKSGITKMNNVNNIPMLQVIKECGKLVHELIITFAYLYFYIQQQFYILYKKKKKHQHRVFSSSLDVYCCIHAT